MLTLRLVFLLLALACLVMRTCDIKSSRIDLMALGLSFWLLAILVTR